MLSVGLAVTIGVLVAPMAPPAKAQEQAASAPDPDAIVGTVNGTVITNRDLEFTLGDLQDQLGQVPPSQQRFAAMMALVDILLLAGKAESEGVADTEAFQRRLAFLRSRALHNSYFRDQAVETITDADVRARYDAEIAATPPENEVSARHILVETEEVARELIATLDGGADFAELAQEHSTGPSGPNGGDLGYFTRGRMVPEFEAAAFALEPGNYTPDPVETQFGWHIIKLEDRRPVQPPAFEQVAGQVRSTLLRERYFELLTGLRNEATIDIADPDLKSAYDATIAAGDETSNQPAQ